MNNNAEFILGPVLDACEKLRSENNELAAYYAREYAILLQKYQELEKKMFEQSLGGAIGEEE